MAKGRITARPKDFLQKAREDFGLVDDNKMRMTLIGMADKYDAQVREIIRRTYDDYALMNMYQGIRNSGVYSTRSKEGGHKKIVEFPNAYVFDFVDTVLTAIYGPDWLNNRYAMQHELVRPWWVVDRI